MFTSSQHNEFWPKFRTALKPAMFDHIGKQEHKVFPEEKASLFLKRNKKEKNRKKNNKQQERALDRK